LAPCSAKSAASATRKSFVSLLRAPFGLPEWPDWNLATVLGPVAQRMPPNWQVVACDDEPTRLCHAKRKPVATAHLVDLFQGNAEQICQLGEGDQWLVTSRFSGSDASRAFRTRRGCFPACPNWPGSALPSGCRCYQSRYRASPASRCSSHNGLRLFPNLVALPSSLPFAG
jgi:hypothetical protein